jgi:hypothetical protein
MLDIHLQKVDRIQKSRRRILHQEHSSRSNMVKARENFRKGRAASGQGWNLYDD